MPQFEAFRRELPGLPPGMRKRLGRMFNLAIAPLSPHDTTDATAAFLPADGETTTYVSHDVWLALGLDKPSRGGFVEIYVRDWRNNHYDQLEIRIPVSSIKLATKISVPGYLNIATDVIAEHFDFDSRNDTDSYLLLRKKANVVRECFPSTPSTIMG